MPHTPEAQICEDGAIPSVFLATMVCHKATDNGMSVKDAPIHAPSFFLLRRNEIIEQVPDLIGHGDLQQGDELW